MVRRRREMVRRRQVTRRRRWRPAEVKALPEPATDSVGEVIYEAEQNCTWPAQVLVNLTPTVSKPSGDGERCVAKTMLLRRVWSLARRDVTPAWEQKVAKPGDAARKRMSAFKAVVGRVLQLEVAKACSRNVGAIFFDVEKHFDSVDLVLLVERTVEADPRESQGINRVVAKTNTV